MMEVPQGEMGVGPADQHGQVVEAAHDLQTKNQQLRRAIVGLIEAVKGTTEWDEHNAACGNERYGDIDGIDDCDCAHADLHAAVKAGEEAKG